MKINIKLLKTKIIFAFISGFTVTISILYILPLFLAKTSDTQPEANDFFDTKAQETLTSPNLSTLGILLLGYGGAGHDGG